MLTCAAAGSGQEAEYAFSRQERLPLLTGIPLSRCPACGGCRPCLQPGRGHSLQDSTIAEIGCPRACGTPRESCAPRSIWAALRGTAQPLLLSACRNLLCVSFFIASREAESRPCTLEGARVHAHRQARAGQRCPQAPRGGQISFYLSSRQGSDSRDFLAAEGRRSSDTAAGCREPRCQQRALTAFWRSSDPQRRAGRSRSFPGLAEGGRAATGAG